MHSPNEPKPSKAENKPEQSSSTSSKSAGNLSLTRCAQIADMLIAREAAAKVMMPRKK